MFGGTWEAIQDRFLLAQGTKTVNTTGGSKDAIVVSHNHGTGNSTYSKFYTGATGIDISATKKAHTNNSSGVYLVYSNSTGDIGELSTTGNTGSSGTDANMPPYLTVYMWKRVG